MQDPDSANQWSKLLIPSHQDILQSLRTWNVDGAIFLGLFDDEIEAMYSVCDVPMVFVDSYSNVRQLSNIGIDDFKGGQLAANYFISRGHRSVAFIGPTMKYNGVIRHRFDGFNSVLRVNGMEVSPEHIFEIESDVRQDAIVALGKHIAPMRKEFSANVSHELKTPLTSISGYAEIMKNGLVRPEDISGFSERIYKEARRLRLRRTLIRRHTSLYQPCFNVWPIRLFPLSPWYWM